MKHILCWLALVGLVSSAVASEGWSTDYKQALETAKTEKKLVVLDFTGSDWCGWCIKLDKEVFSTPEFKKFAGEKLVTVVVDFPNAKPQTDAVKKQNQELQAQYKIQGYPTIIVLNSEGKQVGQLGYQPGGPKAFIAELKKFKP